MKNPELSGQEPLIPKKPPLENPKLRPDQDPFFRKQGKHYIPFEEEPSEKPAKKSKERILPRKKVPELVRQFLKEQEEKDAKQPTDAGKKFNPKSVVVREKK